MTATVIYLKNALCPQQRRIEQVNPCSIRSLSPEWELPFIALVNGQPILRADWEKEIQSGEILAFIDVNAIPQGGGGGGSNPLKIVLSIAVAVFAPALTGALTGLSAASTGAGAWMFNAVNAAIGFVGSALVNALLPPAAVNNPNSAQAANALAAPSPTYSLQAQGNSARIDAAIPEHFGRMIAFPDFAALPYVEYHGNDQFLYQLFCIGRGEYSIEAYRVDDTPFSSFPDITYEVIPPNGSITLFPAQVVTSVEVSGQELKCIAGTYLQSGTTITVTCTGHGVAIGQDVFLQFTTGTSVTGTYTVVTAPDANTFTVTASGSLSMAGECAVSPWLGGYVANASGTTANYIGVDFVMPRGLYFAQDDGTLGSESASFIVQVRPVDGAGIPTGPWANKGTPTYSAATTTAVRKTERYTVTPGRYQVRACRSNLYDTSSRAGSSSNWSALRAYLPEVRNFGDVTLLAVIMKASNGLSMQASRKVNVICTRKLPIWNGTAWSANTATRSIAWPIAYACKQLGLTDAQIDLAALLALDTTWAARGDYFDARFDNFISFWEAVGKMAQAGRAKPYMQAGIVRIMRDQQATIPVALFSMRNIAKGSFSVDYLMPTPATADAVDVTYFDNLNWTSRTVRAKLPTSVAALPAKVSLFGVTGRDQAFREGMYQAAANRYRRKIIKFSTELDGFVPSLGDLIHIQHDMPAWGQGGEVIGWNAVTNTATLSESPTWTAGQTHYIAFRKKDGSEDGPYAVTAGANPNQVVLSVAPTYTPYVGSDYERTFYAFGWATTWRQPARVLSATPRDMSTIDIQAVNEDDNVHTAEVGQVAPTPQSSQLSNISVPPTVTGISFSESCNQVMGGLSVKLDMALTVTGGYDTAGIQVSINGALVQDTHISGLSFSVDVRAGDVVSVSATPMSSSGKIGAVYTANHTVQATWLNAKPSGVGNMTAYYDASDNLWLGWQPVTDIRPITYEVRKGPTYGGASIVGNITDTKFQTIGNDTYWVTAVANGIYSDPSLEIVTGARLVKNVIVSMDERASGWKGSITGNGRVYDGPFSRFQGSIVVSGNGSISTAPQFSAITDLEFFGGMGGTATYTIPASDIVDIGTAQGVQVSVAYAFRAENPVDLFSTYPSIAALDSVAGNYGGYGTCKIQIQTAGDDGIFGEWRDFQPGKIVARKFNFRAIIGTSNVKVAAALDQFQITIDVPDQVQKGTVSIGAGGQSIAYPTAFHAVPNLQLTIQNAQAGDVCVPSAQTATGFAVQVLNGGVGVARSICWLAQGY